MRRKHEPTVEAANFDEKTTKKNDGPNTIRSQRSDWKQQPNDLGPGPAPPHNDEPAP